MSRVVVLADGISFCRLRCTWSVDTPKWTQKKKRSLPCIPKAWTIYVWECNRRMVIWLRTIWTLLLRSDARTDCERIRSKSCLVIKASLVASSFMARNIGGKDKRKTWYGSWSEHVFIAWNAVGYNLKTKTYVTAYFITVICILK